jgi:hypothetical protein
MGGRAFESNVNDTRWAGDWASGDPPSQTVPERHGFVGGLDKGLPLNIRCIEPTTG